MQNQNSKKTDSPHVNTVSRTPRRICTFVMSKPLSSGSMEGVATVESKNLETAFMHQNLMKNRKLSSFMSMPSNNSGRSLATNASSSTPESSMKRSTSFSSVNSNNSNSLQSSHQSRNSSKGQSNRPLAALALPTHPMMATKLKIAFQQYLLVPTSDGNILFYQVVDFTHAEACMQEYELNQNLFTRNEFYHKNVSNQRKMAAKIQQEKESVQPVYSLGPFHAGDYMNRTTVNIVDKTQLIPASIVDISVLENGEGKQTLGTIVILVQEGDVHIFDIIVKQNNTPGTEIDFPEIKADHVHSFNSGNIGATALAAHRAVKRTTVDIDDTTLTHYHLELRISVGFDSGMVVEFAIVEMRHLFKWKGRINSSLRSLAYIHSPKESSSNNRDPLDEDLFLILGSSQEEVDAMEPSSIEDILSCCLDIVHVSGAEKIWKSQYRGARQPSAAIELVDLSIWPINQFKGGGDVPTVSLLGQKKKKKVACGGYKAVLAIEPFQKGQQTFSLLLSNAVIVTMHFGRNQSKILGWGMKGERDQLELPFHSCGISLVDTFDGEEVIKSLTCCFRGGSTVTVPVDIGSPVDSRDAILHTLPFDIDEDFEDEFYYIQGFVAGNIRPRYWGNKSSSIQNMYTTPYIFQAWPGGVIECYACPTPAVVPTSIDRDQQLYKEILSNGALIEILSLLALDHSQLKPESILRRASEEYKLQSHPDEVLMNLIVGGGDDANNLESIMSLVEHLMKGEEIV